MSLHPGLYKEWHSNEGSTFYMDHKLDFLRSDVMKNILKFFLWTWGGLFLLALIFKDNGTTLGELILYCGVMALITVGAVFGGWIFAIGRRNGL